MSSGTRPAPSTPTAKASLSPALACCPPGVLAPPPSARSRALPSRLGDVTAMTLPPHQHPGAQLLEAAGLFETGAGAAPSAHPLLSALACALRTPRAPCTLPRAHTHTHTHNHTHARTHARTRTRARAHTHTPCRGARTSGSVGSVRAARLVVGTLDLAVVASLSLARCSAIAGMRPHAPPPCVLRSLSTRLVAVNLSPTPPSPRS